MADAQSRNAAAGTLLTTGANALYGASGLWKSTQAAKANNVRDWMYGVSSNKLDVPKTSRGFNYAKPNGVW